MIRRRGAASPREESSSEEEEDAFASLARKNTKRAKRGDNNQGKPPLSGQTVASPTIGHTTIDPYLNRRQQQPQQQSSSPAKSHETYVVEAGADATVGTTTGNNGTHNSPQLQQQQQPLPIASLTSSMKRHHKPSDQRKAKMDALLQELKAEKNRAPPADPHRFIPEKKGSFVDQAEEHLTTNIFVGNLAPSITEEALTDLFLQFGELYSVKIMWPRTPAERSRNRNTGFVCFMNRVDAEEAMEACSDTDPFNVGRLLMMRWGKNVKKLVKRGTGGGIALSPILKRPRASFLYGAGPDTDGGGDQFHDGTNNDDPQSIPLDGDEDEDDEDSTSLSNNRKHLPPEFLEMRTGLAKVTMPVKYKPQLHRKDAIRVQAPPNRDRFNFITRVAFFVSKDGSDLEKRLLQRESRNPEFAFLQFNKNAPPQQRLDHLFYRWRVFAFCQGDGFSVWRTEPVVMFHPHGRFWIPPPLDKQAARQEEMDERARQEALQEQKKQRRRLMGKREYRTGRQIERARDGQRGGKPLDGGSSLSTAELEQFDILVRKKLSASRKTICAAMAFCFEKSGAAKEISELVQEALTDPSASLDIRIARLYLLSDILFNSQQPGVKNAFLYRDAIEKMAPRVFTSLGKHGGGNVGRMTMNKLRTAVSGVLGAWTEWSVYNPTFMDELEARFEGREIKDPSVDLKETPHEESKEQQDSNQQEEYKVTIDKPQGDWTEVKEEEEIPRHKKSKTSRNASNSDNPSQRYQDRAVEEYDDPNGDSLGDRDLDGEDLDVEKRYSPTSRTSHRIPLNAKGVDGGGFDGDAIDGEEEDDEDEATDSKVLARVKAIDGEQYFGGELDGEPIDTKELEGEPFDGEKVDTDEIDGESLGGDLVDSESLDVELDGKPVDRQSLDDAAIDGESLDGDAIDGESIDGEALDDVDGDPL